MKSSDSRTPSILIADDQPDVLEALRFLVKGEGYQAESCQLAPGRRRRRRIARLRRRPHGPQLHPRHHFRQEGLDLLNRIQALDSTLPVIVMTAWGSVELAVEAMRRGARDFIQKPWDNARLSAILKTQIELGRALRKGQRLEAENRAAARRAFPPTDRHSRRHAAGARCDLARRTLGRQRADHRRERHRQRPGGAARCIRFRCAPPARWSPSIPADWPKAFSRANSSATSKARSPTPRPIAWAASKWPTAARCSWTKSPTSRMDLQAKLLRTLEIGEFERVGPPRRGAWMCGSSPPPMPIWHAQWPQAASARICCSA